ncbi:SH3 beta-barrel fold-containing protein [Bacteroides faecis]|nr:SH3 beta-barrel fold-containing protein [Bacteroides faecis]
MKKFFHRIYRITQEQESIVYWNMEQHAWRRFMIENLLEWKATV